MSEEITASLNTLLDDVHTTESYHLPRSPQAITTSITPTPLPLDDYNLSLLQLYNGMLSMASENNNSSISLNDILPLSNTSLPMPESLVNNNIASGSQCQEVTTNHHQEHHSPPSHYHLSNTSDSLLFDSSLLLYPNIMPTCTDTHSPTIANALDEEGLDMVHCLFTQQNLGLYSPHGQLLPILSSLPAFGEIPRNGTVAAMSTSATTTAPAHVPPLNIGISTSLSNELSSYTRATMTVSHQRRCANCQCVHTPSWRRNESGTGVLCNACGL
jgi:hypothetical protein